MQHARDLIQKYLDEVATPAELAELNRLVTADPAVAAAFAQATRTDARLSQSFREEGKLADVRPLFPSAQPIARRNLWRSRRWLAAALILLAIGTGLFFLMRKPAALQVVSGEVRVNGNLAARIPVGATVEVVGNQPATIEMLDHSRMELAPASSVVFQGAKKDVRQVIELLGGVGKCQVQKGGGLFRVETVAGTVTVLGTEFSVKLQKRERSRIPASILTVEVSEGSVQVDSGGKGVTLAKGERREFVAEKKPDLIARIETVREEGKGWLLDVTVLKDGEPNGRIPIRMTAQTGKERLGPRPTPGQRVSIWLDPDAKDSALFVEGILAPK